MRINKFVLFAFSLIILSVLAGVTLAQLTNGTMTIKQCQKDCQSAYPLDTQACSNVFKKAIQSCNDARKNVRERCQGLKGQEKRDCEKEANSASQDCKANANSAMRQCKQNALTKRNQCKKTCTVDQDRDGIPDLFDTFTCCLDNDCFEATINDCRSQGGAIMECLPFKITEKLAPSAPQNFTLVNPATQAEWLGNLTRDMNATGIVNRTYVPGTYDCDDFADDMERNLTTFGYNATYTVYWCYNSTGHNTTAHAVTDVHAPDGSLVFVEPQRGTIINLDFDGDGQVGARTHHENNRVDTDDSCEIEVYQDAASATAAGAPRD